MSTGTPLFSVIMPLYNKAPWVGRALRSALSQSVPDLEVLVVDDGSTDGGAAVVRTFSDQRVRLISQANQGVSAARNAAMAASKGRHYAFLDADDEWEPDFLATIAELTERWPEAGLYGTGFLRHYPAGRIGRMCLRDTSPSGAMLLINDYFRRVQQGAFHITSSTCVPRAVIADVGGFVVGERYEDMDLWGRIAIRYPVAYSCRLCCHHHLDATNHTVVEDQEDRPLAFVRSMRSALADNRVPEWMIPDLLDYMDFVWLGVAFRCLRQRRRRMAWRVLSSEVRREGRYGRARAVLRALMAVAPCRVVYLLWKAARTPLGYRLQFVLPPGLTRYWG